MFTRSDEERAFREAVGRNMRRVREARGMTMTDVSEAMGYAVRNAGWISLAERGLVHVTFWNITRFARAVGVGVETLLP